MKKALRLMLFLLTFAVGATAYGQWGNVGQSIGSLVYLDGVNVLEKAEITLKRDDLLLLEAFDLQPQSSFDFRAKSGPSTVSKETFTTDQSGALHQILFFPKNHSRLKCYVKYTTKNGESRKLQFELKPIN
jgi:hypothetical protein